jgi:hypothetical protein
MSVIIGLKSGEAKADLILQFGAGTDNPSAMIINHSGEAEIELGDIQRFADDELEVKAAALAPETKRKNAEAKS